MPSRERHQGRAAALQCQTNLVKHITFNFSETINVQNKRINHLFKERVSYLVDNQKQRSPNDFISIEQARAQVLLQTGRAVSHSTIARWVSQNNLGHKLLGKRGQWVVDGPQFNKFLGG